MVKFSRRMILSAAWAISHKLRHSTTLVFHLVFRTVEAENSNLLSATQNNSLIESMLNRTFLSFRCCNKTIFWFAHATFADNKVAYYWTETMINTNICISVSWHTEHKLVNFTLVNIVSAIYPKMEKCFHLPIQNIVIAVSKNRHYRARLS